MNGLLRKLIGRRDGAVSIISAAVLPALIVAVGFAVEYGNGLLNKVRDQRIADGAAFSAATVYVQNQTASLTSVADDIAALDGLSASDISASLVSSPSGDGNNAVKVTVTTQVPLLLSQALGDTTSFLTATAVAYAEIGGGNSCVLVLDPSSSGKPASITGGTAKLNCDMQVNSTSSTALYATGGTLTATNFDIVGQSGQSGGTLSGTINNGSPSVADPFSGLFASNNVSSLTNQTCPSANQNVNWSSGSQTITPPSAGQVYCGGLTISGATVTLQPGVYIIQGGTFTVSSGSLTGSGVTIILTCGSPPCTSASNDWATATFSGGTTNLSAPVSGSWEGMLIYQDPTNSNDGGSTTNTMSGGSNTLQGNLYFPDEHLNFTGGSVPSNCMQIVAFDLTFTGGGTINHDCTGAGVTGFGAGSGSTSVRLVQ